jgi:hypothetical protein
MATNPVDPIDEEIRRALADPNVRASLERARERAARGEHPTGSNDHLARRIVGLSEDEDPDE